MPYKEVTDMSILMKIRNGQAEDCYPAFAPPMIKKGIQTIRLNPDQLICVMFNV